MMRVIHSIDYATPMEHGRLRASVFLAGPTPRDPGVPSWRPEAIELFRSMGHDGWIFVPEAVDRRWDWNADDQLHWEQRHLEQASVIMFWIPRSEDKLPGLTTNLEFGMWISADPGRVVFGAPADAWKMKPLEHYGRVHGVKRHWTLPETVDAAMARLFDQEGM